MDKIKTLQMDQEIWDLYTRKEEYITSIRDEYDRFPYNASSRTNIFEPTVSKYLLIHGYRVEYPEDKPFAVCLTHDIDILYQKKVTNAIFALKHLRNFQLSACVKSLLEISSNPHFNFLDIIELEDHYGAKSSFYFMVENLEDKEYAYNIEDCQTIIGEISDRGWEVGLHGGQTAYNNPVELKKKKQLLEQIVNKKVTGYRNHYLRFRVPETWEHLCSAGFLYDTTFGYAECIGFRNGMCHPFRPYNLATQQEIDIIEIPLTIMDRSLDFHMKIDLFRAWELTKRLINTVAECNGVITILWHNNTFIGEQRKFYEKILRYCSEKNAWMTNGEEIAKWVSHSE
jgi:peptidoglycan/xylan/chitin deacetylase (PgdA/CDA1 family)